MPAEKRRNSADGPPGLAPSAGWTGGGAYGAAAASTNMSIDPNEAFLLIA
jgi:hypothetical protein